MTRDAKVAVLRDQARSCLQKKKFNAEPQSSRWATVGVTADQNGNMCVAVRIRTVNRKPGLEQEVTQRVQTELNPSRIDMQYTGPVLALPLKETATETRKTYQQKGAAAAAATLRIGSSISLANARTGTLGFFARCRKTNQIGIVSANHVIGGQDRAQRGDAILTPGGSDFGMRVASFVRFVPLAGETEKYVDCAFARLETASWDPESLPGKKRLQPKPAVPAEGTRVFKFSEESGLTEGVVTLADQDQFKMHYRSGVGLVLFDNQIEVESANPRKPFATSGDSGALVWDEQGRPVGLLFAQTLNGGRHGNGLSYVNPISAVLCELDVELVTAKPR
jgi:hypothetical protein